MPKKFKVEKNWEGKWYWHGTYGMNFIPQLCAAVGDLSRQGFEMYKTIRVTEVDESDPDYDRQY